MEMKTFTLTLVAAALAWCSSGFALAQDAPALAAPVAPPKLKKNKPSVAPLAPADVAQVQPVERDLLAQAANQFKGAVEDYTAAVADADFGLAVAQAAGEPFVARFSGKTPTRTLVIQTSKGDRREQGEIEEDLAVMSHLFEKTIRQAGGGGHPPAKAMGINVYSMSGSQPIQSFYLEGYGALFMLNAKFPLLAPPEKKEEPKEEEPQDSSWNEARRELFGARGGDAFSSFNKVWKAPQAAEEFDADKVSKLKDALLESLKNASNIRHLKPDEFITITVVGPSSGPYVARGRTKVATAGGFGREERFDGDVMRTDGRGDTILTFRAKKSDVDAFAKGKLSLDEFRDKTNMQTYTSGTSSRSAQLLHAPENVRATVQRRQSVQPRPATPAWPEAPAPAPAR
ncbi:MAG: hypothetical protein DME26_08035 [Verrucomicrobia bacterium]|nr:MAG: hypothetical protein DME26_08035 [Verrucomicrobiota bacterium]